MGKEQDWKNLGEQILDSVASALNTGDFRQLNDLVSGTVNDAVNEAKRQADREKSAREEILRQYQRDNAARRDKWIKQQEELYKRREERREEWRRIREASNQYAQTIAEDVARNSEATPKSSPRPKAVRVRFNKVGSVSNVLYTTFGAISLGVGSAIGIIALAMGVVPLGIMAAIIIGVSSGMLRKGSKQRGILKRAQRYIEICGNKRYADLSEIAAQTGNSVRFVKKDIKKMLRAGMFPEGHLDQQETCFMLTNEVYRQYTETAEAFKMREQMEADRLARENRPKTLQEEKEEMKRQQESELNTMVAEGMEYVNKLRTLNDAIPSQEITGQLSKLEGLLRQIFDRVKDHPEQMNRLHKLMDYYLPTTVKLVEAYVGFEKVEKPGQDIQDAKSEIQKTLGIINEAFEELLNNLFQDETFDAITDAQVLQQMLSREGLRREMSSPFDQEQGQTNSTAELEQEEGTEQEESPFSLTMEPEQPEVMPSLKAPWES